MYNLLLSVGLNYVLFVVFAFHTTFYFQFVALDIYRYLRFAVVFYIYDEAESHMLILSFFKETLALMLNVHFGIEDRK